MNSTANMQLLQTENNPTLESKIAISVVLGFFLLCGSMGSLCTMVVIRINKNLHTTANCFIFSLCVSDLISALVCSPLWMYRRTWGYERWQLGSFLCKFYWVSDFATNYVTSLHIMSFALLRYVAVKRPFHISMVSQRAAVVYISTLWVFSISLALPLALIIGVQFDRANHSSGEAWPSCSLINDNKGVCCVRQYSLYFLVVDPLLFYIPETIIIILSLSMVFTLLKQRRWRQRFMSSTRAKKTTESSKNPPVTYETSAHLESTTHIVTTTITSIAPWLKFGIFERPAKTDTLSQTERSTFLQLTLIVIAFMIGYIPFTIYLVWASTTPEEIKGRGEDYWFGTLSYLCLRFSECLNPLMYNLGSSALREATLKFLRKLKCRFSHEPQL